MTKLIPFDILYQLDQPRLKPWFDQLRTETPPALQAQHNGDLSRWLAALEQLPTIKPSRIVLDAAAITVGAPADVDSVQRQQLEQVLREMQPWRKGPFELFGLMIDTEWRSDWKWDRLKNYIAPLAGRCVLDVGCGSGYHCWRMRGAGAKLVIGIDPTALFNVQFHSLQRYIHDTAVHVLPQRMEELPAALHAFDTVFSMGVLYHRRSPFDHLHELKAALRPGGELVLESLVIDGKAGDVLVPEGRYGKMGNVWFIPGVLTLESWLRKAGFTNIRCVNVCTTTLEEQRTTAWMPFQSLQDFLDPNDRQKTIEGHPAPQRAVLLANAPA